MFEAPAHRRASVAAAATLVLLVSPAAAQSYRLTCEVEMTASVSSNGGNAPIRQRHVEMLDWTIDPAARRAVIRSTNPDGTPATALRALDIVDARQIILCQAEACQRPITVNGATETHSVTLIDLATGTLSRTITANIPASGRRASIHTVRSHQGRCWRA